MTEKYISYKVGQDTYDVPESMMLAFEKKFPSATIEMHVGEDIYDVPFKDRDAFLNKFSNATFTFDKAGALRSGSAKETQLTEDTQVEEVDKTAHKVSFWDSLAANPAQSALAIQNAKNPKKKAEVNTDMADATIASHAQTQEKIDEYISNFEQAYAEKASEGPRQKISFWESIASNPAQSALRIQKNEMGQDYADARIAKRITDKTQDKVDQYNDPSETFVGGAWEGIKDSAFDIDTWDSTVGLEQAQRIHAISQKLDNGETLSEGEQLIIDALVDDLASDMYLAAGFGRGYKAGMVTGESLPFMVETMLNPASGWGKAVAKKFGGSVLKRVATRVAVDIAGAAVMSATTSSARVSADALNRLSGQVDFTIDDNGQFHFTGFAGGEDSAFKAYAKAFGANTIEHFSEMVGDYFSPIGKAVGGWSKGAAVWSADKIGLKKLSTMIKEMTPNGFGAAFGHFLEKTQWHGMIGEFSEEMISGAMNALIVGDQSLRKYDKDGNLNENYIFDKDNMIDTFLGVALLGGFMSSVKTLGYSNPETEHNRKINLAKKGLEEILTDEQKQMLYDFADNPFGADYTDVRELMDGKSVEEKTAIANYLKAVMGKQGFLLGRNADLSGTKQGMEEMQRAFQFGHGLSEADLYDVNEAEAHAMQKLADTGHADVSGLSSYEIYRLSTDANLSAEQQIALHDLAVIKNAKEGLQSKLNSVAKAAVGITSGIANSAAKDGSIKVSTLNGRTVYVKGDVQIQFGSIVKPDGVSAYPVEVVDQITGEVSTVDSGDLDVIDVYAADAYVTQMSDAIMNSYQQSWENWKTTKSVRSKLADIQQMVGQKVYINAPNGMAQVEIQQILPNGEVVIKGKKSDLGQTTIRVDVDALYDSMSRDSSGNVIFDPSVFRSQSEQTGAPEAPAAPTTPEAPAVPTAPEAPVSPEGTGVQDGDEEYSDDPIDLTPIEDDFDNIEELDETEETEEPVGEDIDFRDQEVEILIDGKPTTVEVTYQDETSNTITYTYVDANGRSRVGSSTIDAFKSAWQQAQNYTEPVEEPVAEPVEAPDSGENAPLEPETINWEELFTRDQENFLAELQRQYGDNADRYIKAMIASAEKQIAKLEKSAPEDANEIFANEQAMDALRARIATLNDMLSRLNATEEVSTEEENAGESHENPVTLGEEQTGESNEGDEVHGTEGHSDETGSAQADDERGEETGETSETLRDGDFDNSEVDKKYPPRKGDITVQALGDTFGFASVELTESEDQQAINSIYDIFMEMAKMLGISPKSIAHGGTLSLAHVPSSVKKETLGRYDWLDIKLELRNSELSSILHEWWHALDHALHSSNLTGTITDFTSAVSKTRFSGRPEVKEAVNKILAAVKKSGHIDRINRSWFPRSYKRYTKEKVEQTARAFEEYIMGKFAEKGIAIEGLKRSSNEAQPTAEEMAMIAPEFDNLFSILMEREGAVAGTSILFQIGQMMEQGDKVKAELGELVADWIRQGGNFVVMDTDAMAAALEEAGVNANVLETMDGVVYGFVKDGKVYLNPELINPNTSIHEYTHLWDLALMQLNPALWEKGKKLMKQTPLWDEVINDPNYADIKDNEDLVASEVHSRLVGENGAEVLSQLEQQAREEGLTKSAKKLSILGRLREWLDEATKWLKNAFTAWDKTELDALTLDDFLNMPLSDLANFTKLQTEGVVTNEAGELIADNKGNGHIQFSISTWRDGGRDYLVNWLKKDKTLTKEEKAEIIARMDEFYENALKYTDVYVPFGSWSEAAVKYDKDGNPLMSVIKKNGDYSMNLDFSLVCKKRRPLNKLLRTLIARNAFGTYSLRERELAEINWILQEHGFEVACALCFVDSKRYRVTGVADVFAELYNKFVRALAPEGAKIAHFNYSNNPNIENVDGGLDTMPDSELNWNRFDELASQYGPDTVEGKVARFLRDNPSQRRLVDSTDFIDSKGFEAVKESNPALLSLYNSKKGTGGPKASFGDVQYLNDILKKSRSFSAKKAYDVGGVRIQSFSDFVAHMYFDYMQLFAELAAKRLPAHAYTKEVLFAKIFGLTGLKINMSLVPAVVEGGIAPGLDADGNYAWADAVKDAEGNVIQQAQSFPYDEAMKIQHAEGYSKNCGVIAVGISDEHIEKMLDDPNIPFIIPYHKSSLNAIVARMTNIDQYKDYTNVQNTRNADGTKLDDGVKDFNFNAWLRQHPDATPQQAAQAYLDWCRENNYKPKFSQFAYHPNYYKLLVDFNTIDARTGEYTPQGPVSMTFPTEQNEFGDVETLIQQGLQEDAELEEKMDSEIEQVADEVEKRLEEIKNEPKLSEKEYAKKIAQIADERKAEKWKKESESDGLLFRPDYIHVPANIYTRISKVLSDRYQGDDLYFEFVDIENITYICDYIDRTAYVRSIKETKDESRRDIRDIAKGREDLIEDAVNAVIDFLRDSGRGQSWDSYDARNGESSVGHDSMDETEIEEETTTRGNYELPFGVDWISVKTGYDGSRKARVVFVEKNTDEDEFARKSDVQNASVDFLAGDARLNAIERAVNEEAEKLGVKVTYKTREEMPKGHQNDKGYYNTKTGEIVVCTENASSIADAIQTILHEAVAHKGLRQLMGDRFHEFINRVYNSLDGETKTKVDALAESQYDGDIAVAMEEYMASLAETTDFAENSVWDKIKSIFNDIINAILGRNDMKIGDNELRYILRASYNNLVNPRVMETVRGWAQDQMMREELGIGKYVTPEMDKAYMDAVERGDMETASRLVLEAAKLAMPYTKVVDEDGSPKVVYHGRGSEFNVFEHQDYAYENASGKGFYFTDDPKAAALYTMSGFLDNTDKMKEALYGILYDEYGLDSDTAYELASAYIYDGEAEFDQIEEAYAKAIKNLFPNPNVLKAFINIERPYDIKAENAERESWEINKVLEEKNLDGVIDENFSEAYAKLFEVSPEYRTSEKFAQYMVRNSNQIKSAEPVTYDDSGNVIPLSERFNPESEDIRYRTGVDPDVVAQEGAAAAYNKAVAQEWQEFQRQFQDAFQPVRNAIEAIQQATGEIPVEEYENYLLIQNQASSRSRAEIDNFTRKYYSPIFDQVKAVITAVMESRGYSKREMRSRKKRAEVYREIIQYLIAKHGLERNKYYQETKRRKLYPNELKPRLEEELQRYNEAVAAINADASLSDAERELKLRDAKDEYKSKVDYWKSYTVPDLRDYSGLTSLFGLDKKEYEEAQRLAKELVDDFETSLGREDDSETGDMIAQSEVIKALWEKINAATDYTLTHSYKSGLLSKKQYEDIKAMFKFYIPLRGFDETTAEDVYEYARFEGNRFNPAVQTAKGRFSIADDPLATIMNMAESEIAQGNKNRAKVALYNYLLNRAAASGEQNDLMQIEDVWYQKTVTDTGEVVYSIAVPDRENGETYDEFEERMRLAELNDEAYKSKKGKLDIGLKFQKKRHEGSHYVYLKVNGVEKAIYINGDPKAADAINGTYVPDMSDGEKHIKNIQRFLSSMHTNYSLKFTIKNLFRDMYYSMIMLGIKESPEYGRKFRANWWRNNAFAVMSMLSKYRRGEYDGVSLSEDEAMFVEFMENGGPTGYTVINSVENHKKDLERAIKRMQKGIRNGGVKDSAIFRYTLGAIEFLNECSEMATRFAAYKTSRDMGRGVVTSVSDAKEVTVNFNTKGAQDGKGWYGTIARYFGFFKYFFNASVQGSQNLISAVKKHPVKFCSTACGVVGLGIMMPVINSMILELLSGGDDDEYWNIPEYDRQNNLCFVLGKTGKYLKIPYPIGFREMFAIGDIMAGSALDKSFNRDPLTVGMNVANKLSAMILPLNPLEGTTNGLSLIESAYDMFAPDANQFVMQNRTNKDWKGTPIQKEYTYNEHDPEWTKAFSSNPSWLTGLSKWCYEHIDIAGRPLDFSPEKLDNTLSNTFGGTYSLIKGVGKSVEIGLNEASENGVLKGAWKGAKALTGGALVGSGIDDDARFVNSEYWKMNDYYNNRIGRIESIAGGFGLTLDDVFKRTEARETPAGAHHPQMSKIYNSDYFDFMQEWYLGHKGDEDENGDKVLGLDQIKNKMKTVKNNINKAEDAEYVKELTNDLLELEILYDKTRSELVNDLLELD